MATPTSPDEIAWLAQQAKVDKMQKELESLNSQNRKIKGTTGHEKIQKQILQGKAKKLLAEMGVQKEKLAGLQNKFYESSGQYEKLLAGTERDAFMALNALFKTYKLDSLAGKIFEYVKNGYSADTISILLQDTKEYRERFAGNEARKAAGLAVLSPGEYLSTESAYQQIMESAGLPVGFYDQHSDFAGFIGKNKAPSEIQKRVDLAVQATALAPPGYRDALKQMGLSDGEMVAYWLNADKALPYIQKAAATAAIGAAALSQQMTFDQQYAESLATQGITAEQARQGYAAIASDVSNMAALGSIYGESWGQRQSEEEVFEGKNIAKRQRLISQEKGAFSGAAGGSRTGLAQRGGAR